MKEHGQGPDPSSFMGVEIISTRAENLRDRLIEAALLLEQWLAPGLVLQTECRQDLRLAAEGLRAQAILLGAETDAIGLLGRLGTLIKVLALCQHGLSFYLDAPCSPDETVLCGLSIVQRELASLALEAERFLCQDRRVA